MLIIGLSTAVLAVAPREVCGSCHAMKPYAQSLGESSHPEVACGSCHAPTSSSGIDIARRVVFKMVPLSVARRAVAGPGEGTPDEGCSSCHPPGAADEVIDRDGIRVMHSVCAAEQSCVSCHGATAHGEVSRVRRTFTMEGCAGCHVASKATTECDACHSPHAQHERLERGPWQVTHGAQWSQTHGLGSLKSCGVCHPADYCVRCHGTALPHPPGFGQTHGDEAKKDLNVCKSCHETETLCTPCHTMEMPHPDGFLKQHSSLASSVDEPACARCHDRDECASCHVRHVHPGNAAAPPKAGS